jgi:hypothetical protein
MDERMIRILRQLFIKARAQILFTFHFTTRIEQMWSKMETFFVRKGALRQCAFEALPSAFNGVTVQDYPARFEGYSMTPQQGL